MLRTNYRPVMDVSIGARVPGSHYYRGICCVCGDAIRVTHKAVAVSGRCTCDSCLGQHHFSLMAPRHLHAAARISAEDWEVPGVDV